MKKNYLFLGFAIPDKEMEKSFENDKFPAIQTHKFNWNLIKGIEHTNKIECTYISARPISDYPNSSERKVKYNEWVVKLDNKDIKIYEIPYKNTSILKIISRLISGTYYSIKNYHKKQNKGGVIVYSVHVPFMIIGYIISKIYNIDYVAIWTDPPSVSHNREGYLKSKLRSLEFKISKILMDKADKVVALTKYLANDFAPNSEYIVVEGIIDCNELDESKKSLDLKNNKIKIAYTGSLEKRYGIKNIVDGFMMTNNDKLELQIYGRGDYEAELIRACNKDNRILYKGFVSNNKVLEIQKHMNFLINARAAEDEYVKYSFPSKTLEYMLSGTPIITTMLPGIPDEYEDYFIILKDNKPETIKSKLDEIIKKSEFEYEEIGLRAKSFAKTKNYINQGNKIVDFIMQKKGEYKS